MDTTSYQWAVIGAGPAGIAAVGKLLDQGIPSHDILWLDPQFKVGDLGQFWSNVSSNTKVKYFNNFLFAVSSFEYEKAEYDFSLKQLNEEHTCTLTHIVQPLQWITDHLREKVIAIETWIESLSLSLGVWNMKTAQQEFEAKNVILAIGAVPSILNYPEIDMLPFDVAIDNEKLIKNINPDKCYAVFGSSHSAIIIVRHLVDAGVKKVINFYRSPCRYAVDMGDWILFDNTGLKGQTAAWARQYIDGTLPHNLVRYHASKENISRLLPECDKAIYAVGFDKRTIHIEGYEELTHNPHVGIIAPGLFGLGIAYPEQKTDPYGSKESQVGLWKFMVYINKVLPVWLKYST